MLDLSNIKKELSLYTESKYQKFSASLIPGAENLIGIRIPVLRSIAKEIARGDYHLYFTNATDDTFEEIMLQGLVIGFLKTDLQEIFERLRIFIPKINNWSHCDYVVQNLKLAAKKREDFWDFILPYAASEKEFEARFAVVTVLSHFAVAEYAHECFTLFDNIAADGYYTKMAVAWAVQKFFVKLPDVTMEYLKNNRLDDFTYNKALSKICESLVPDKETKEIIKSMKRPGRN